jgi:hypothetical protein
MTPLRLMITPTGPDPHLEPHYRPWPCPPGATMAVILGSKSAWWNWSAALTVYAQLEWLDAQMDARSTECFAPFWDGQVWRFGRNAC